jgi:hypothetical protein
VSLTEIKSAVEALSADELAELAAFVRERENRAWDKQIDADFAEGGRLSRIAEEAREDLRAGRLHDLPGSAKPIVDSGGISTCYLQTCRS